VGTHIVYCSYAISGEYGLKRKMLAAKEDLVDQVNEIANRRGLTLYAITNEALEQVVKLDEMGSRLGDVVRDYEIFKAAKDAGFVLIPESLLYETMEKAYNESKGWMMKKWIEIGEWCGKYYSVKNPEDKFERLKEDVCRFFWNTREFNIVQNGNGEVLVRCMSPRFQESYAVFLGEFLDGAFGTMGYKCTQKDVSKGFVQLKFEGSK
jgi:hypothetical protein